VERAAAASAVEAFASLPGAGATARVGDRELLGSPALMASRGVDVTGSDGGGGLAEVIARLQDQAATAIVLAETPPAAQAESGGTAARVLGVAGTVRDGVADAIAALRRHGVERVLMLTGDNPRTAKVICQQVGADDYLAEHPRRQGRPGRPAAAGPWAGGDGRRRGQRRARAGRRGR
jgi:cation transport ATPase